MTGLHPKPVIERKPMLVLVVLEVAIPTSTASHINTKKARLKAGQIEWSLGLYSPERGWRYL